MYSKVMYILCTCVLCTQSIHCCSAWPKPSADTRPGGFVLCANRCSRFTCKACHCYKRTAEHETEDVVLSSRFQDYLNNLSSSEESESGSDNETDDSISTSSEIEYHSDINELDNDENWSLIDDL